MSREPAAALATTVSSDEWSDRLAALFDAHEERLYRLSRRLCRNSDEARDLVHDTFLKAAESLRSVPNGFAKEEAWLVRVLINIRRDQWRKTAVRKRAASTLRDSLISYPSTVESALIAKRTVWAALDLLPPRRRAIVIVHELEGMSLSAIASLPGVAGITVRWHLSMGRRDLKQALAPQLGDTI